MDKLVSFSGSGPIGPNKYWEYPWLMNSLDLKEGLKVLDAGCGRSPIQFLLADLGLSVSAIDPCENVGWHGIDKRLAKKFNLDIDYRVEGMEKISYKDETFDRVISISVLEHCRAIPVKNELLSPQADRDKGLQAQMIKEMARVLKKGGILLITLDIMFPGTKIVLESNIDVKNLIEASGLELLGTIEDGVYGEEGFDIEKLEAKENLDIQDYMDVKGTSLGLIFKK